VNFNLTRLYRIINAVLFCLVGSVSVASTALAADLTASNANPTSTETYNWSGIYAGVNGGWGSSQKCWDFTTPNGTFLSEEGCHDVTGGTAGGQIGYRWQRGTWVLGVEAQGNWADFHGSNVSLVFPAYKNDSRMDAFGLFTGHIGYAWKNTLFYAKGGAAATSSHYRGMSDVPSLPVSDVVDDTQWGGVAGAGVEYGFAPNWSAAIEYDHMFMPDKSHRFTDSRPGAGLFGTDRIHHQDVDLIAVRISYHWGSAKR
jgi:outer membrane immunogenic protein